MKIQLFGKRIAIEIVKVAPKVGSIYVPVEAQKNTQEGIVRFIGEEIKDLNLGDRVLYNAYAGTPMTFCKTDLLVLEPIDVYARILDE